MKKKSGSRRRTKVVHRSKKNLRRTIKRKSFAKGRRRPTRRHSRIQRGGVDFFDKGWHWEYAGDQGNSSGSTIPVEERYRTAMNMYTQGARRYTSDSLKCAYRMGIIYENGKNRTRVRDATMINDDNKNAFEWYSKATSIGDILTSLMMPKEYADAQYRLGKMYEEGRGVAQDDVEAVRLYSLAAAQGHAGAQFNLGGMFDKGQGVAQDYAEAVRLYRLAAAQGHVDAQFNLGYTFEHGEGVAQDRAEAIRWYRLAAAQGDADAEANLKRLGA